MTVSCILCHSGEDDDDCLVPILSFMPDLHGRRVRCRILVGSRCVCGMRRE